MRPELMPGVVDLLPEAYDEAEIPEGEVLQVIVHSFADGPGATRMRDYLARKDVSVEYNFGVYSTGKIEQWVPVGYAADATIDAKDRSVSIVFESDSTSSSKPFTEEQWDALIRISSWLHEEWDIPLRLIPKGQPTGAGYGWHRMYIDGNESALGFASDLDFQGTMNYSWSTSRGKTCPGDLRVRRLEAEWILDVKAELEVSVMTPELVRQIVREELDGRLSPLEFFVRRQRDKVNPARAKLITSLQRRTSSLESERP